MFGFTYTDMGQGVAYSTIELDGRTVGGIGDVALVGAGTTSRWRAYFGTVAAAATCAKATELGGTVAAEPWDTLFGKMAAITGPGGESFLINEAPSG